MDAVIFQGGPNASRETMQTAGHTHFFMNGKRSNKCVRRTIQLFINSEIRFCNNETSANINVYNF